MNTVMSLEEESRRMLSAGCFLRKGTDEFGYPIEYWDVPKNPAEMQELKKQQAMLENQNG